jgi:hypothetical protein
MGESGIVRDFMGGRMFAMHLRSPELYRVIPHAPAWQYWAVNRERRAVLISLNGRDEFVVHTQLTPGPQADQISNAAAIAMLHVVLGAELDVELIARSTWNAGYTLVAEVSARPHSAGRRCGPSVHADRRPATTPRSRTRSIWAGSSQPHSRAGRGPV